MRKSNNSKRCGKEVNKETLKFFCISCFNILMENGEEGFYQKAPAYVLEKYSLIHNAYVIYNMLHMVLRPHLIAYGDAWGEDFKGFVKQMDKDIQHMTVTAFENKYAWRE